MVPPTNKELKATEGSVLKGAEGAVLRAEAAGRSVLTSWRSQRAADRREARCLM